MKSFWVTFKGRAAGCVEANSPEEATEIAKRETGLEVLTAKSLPYPANPRINKYIDPKYGECPSFCFKPNECCGKTSCPQRYSCVE